jgi:hypothetical protein
MSDVSEKEYLPTYVEDDSTLEEEKYAVINSLRMISHLKKKNTGSSIR